MTNKTIGILGGMGPEATASLYQKIISHTPARTDQDHLHVIIDANPAVPDRTRCILEHGPSPVPVLRQMARRLESAGADLLILPCNTAHFFIGEALRGVAVPFIDMIDETVKTCRDALPGDGRIGLLATSGTLAARVYHDRFETTGLNLLVPGEAEQQRVMEGIYQGVKAGRLDYGAELLEEAAAQLIDRGAQLIIGGCTEVPLVLGGKNLGVPFIDTLDVLAAAAVNRARPHSSLEGDRSPA